MPNTVLDPINCRHVARTTSTADSLVKWEGDSYLALLTTWRINRISSSSLAVGWILWTAPSHVILHSQLLTSLSTLHVVLILDPFIWWQQTKGIIIHQAWQRCECSLNCRLTQTGLLLEYCSITSHLPFTRLCSDSIEHLHPVCSIKSVWEQSET